MERLTYRDKDGMAMMKERGGWKSGGIDRLAAYEDTGLEPEDLKKAFNETAILKLAAQVLRTTPDHLRDLLQAEQDGRLVVLPCKVGDRVFHVRRVTQAEAKRMGAPVRHRGIVYYEDRPFAIKEKLCTKSDYAQIGKTVFLTREEAEAALKGGDLPEKRTDRR